MCTASWLRDDGSLHLFFNRDEERTREAGAGPAVEERDGVRFLAPRDGRAGGTWLAASERGLALALLNRSAGTRPERPGSRGRLIPRLAPAAEPDDLVARLLRQPLRDLAPFRLLALWRAPAVAALATWDGSHLGFEPLDAQLGLLCSSGLDDRRAEHERGAAWERHRAATTGWSPAAHRAFHRSHDPEPSPWSVCMHRPEAETVSYAELDLTPREARLRYFEGPPCRAAAPLEAALSVIPRPALG